MSCDVGKVTGVLENELWRRWCDGKVWEWAELRAVEQSSFSKLSGTSPTSHLILQPFPRFTYVTTHSLTLLLLHLRHSSFSNPSSASSTSQALNLRHLASRPWFIGKSGRLCNIIDGIKTFWNILHNLEILCRLWVVFRNILSVLLFRFSFLCLSIDYEYKMWRKSICYWMYRTV